PGLRLAADAALIGCLVRKSRRLLAGDNPDIRPGVLSQLDPVGVDGVGRFAARESRPIAIDALDQPGNAFGVSRITAGELIPLRQPVDHYLVTLGSGAGVLLRPDCLAGNLRRSYIGGRGTFDACRF